MCTRSIGAAAVTDLRRMDGPSTAEEKARLADGTIGGAAAAIRGNDCGERKAEMPARCPTDFKLRKE